MNIQKMPDHIRQKRRKKRKKRDKKRKRANRVARTRHRERYRKIITLRIIYRK